MTSRTTTTKGTAGVKAPRLKKPRPMRVAAEAGVEVEPATEEPAESDNVIDAAAAFAQPSEDEAPAPKPEAVIVVTTADLLGVATRIKRYKQTKSSIPILSSVRLIGMGGRLTAEVTNLDSFAREYAPCTLAGETVHFEVVIDRDLFCEFVATLPRGAMAKLTATAADTCRIDCEHLQGEFATQALADWPMSWAGPRSAEAPVLRASLNLSTFLGPVLHAAAEDESRPVLAAVEVSWDQRGLLRASAADGFRLAVVEHQINDATFMPPGRFDPESADTRWAVLIHIDAARYLAGTSEPAEFIAHAGSDYQVGAQGRAETGDGWISVQRKDGFFSAHVVGGTAPDFQRIVQGVGNGPVARVNAAALARGIRSVMATMEKGSRNAVELHVAEGKITASSLGWLPTLEAPGGRSEIQCEYDLDPFKFCLNWNYIVAALAVHGDAVVDLAFSKLAGTHLPSPESPLLVRGPGSIQVIMPMHKGS